MGNELIYVFFTIPVILGSLITYVKAMKVILTEFKQLTIKNK